MPINEDSRQRNVFSETSCGIQKNGSTPPGEDTFMQRIGDFIDRKFLDFRIEMDSYKHHSCNYSNSLSPGKAWKEGREKSRNYFYIFLPSIHMFYLEWSSSRPKRSDLGLQKEEEEYDWASSSHNIYFFKGFRT